MTAIQGMNYNLYLKILSVLAPQMNSIKRSFSDMHAYKKGHNQVSKNNEF